MILPKIKLQSNFSIDSQNSIQKIDIYAVNNHIEINNIRDDQPLSSFVNEDLILSLLENKTRKLSTIPKVIMADALLDIKDSLPQHNSVNIVNDPKPKPKKKNRNVIERIYEKVKVPNMIKEDKRRQELEKRAEAFKKRNNVISITEDML